MNRFSVLIIVIVVIGVAFTTIEGQLKNIIQLKSSQIGTVEEIKNETNAQGVATISTNDVDTEPPKATQDTMGNSSSGQKNQANNSVILSGDTAPVSSNQSKEELWQNGLYDGPICPGLLQISDFTMNQSTPFPKPNVTMMQLEGSWTNNETAALYHRVYEHNARMSARHGYHAVSITNTSRWAEHPAFAKILAIRDYCLEEHNPELVWFLDGDIVIMNPLIPVEMIWFYYKAQHEEMNMLFACDNNDLNSGLFIVNCSSPTTVQTLEYWELYTHRVNSWKNIQAGMYEQNAIHWLIQTPFWQSFHPRYKRTDKLVRRISPEEKKLYSVDELRKRVRVIDNICELTVFPIEFICDATINEKYFTKGPRWWEDGHFAVHTAGTRNPALRLPYLTNVVEKGEAIYKQLSADPGMLQDSARQYVTEYSNGKSIDPPKSKFNRATCMREERKAKREAQKLYRIQQAEKEEKLRRQNETASSSNTSSTRL